MHAPSPPARFPRGSAAALLVVVALLAAACGTTVPSPGPSVAPSPSPSVPATVSPGPSASPSPAPSVDADAVYDEIEAQVIAIRGLEPAGAVERATISEDELREFITAEFAEEYPPEYIAATERFYVAFGLMPEDEDLEELTLDLLSGGVAGFYRDDVKRLYVVSKSGAVGGNEKITFAHEFDHALQDQHFTVFADQEGLKDQTDRIYARQAVYEGDATLLMTLWATQHFSPTDMAEVLEAGNDPEQQALLERMPAILRDTLIYPYTTGLVFAQGIYLDGGWEAIDALYDDLPVSTEQILHADKWAAREAPVPVDLPDDLATRLGDGWTVPLEDTFGELQMGIWLREAGVPATDATAAAAGWGGDRIAVATGPDGAWAAIMATAWDDRAEAIQFEAAAGRALDAARGSAALLPGAGGTTRWVLVASDDAALERVAGALGLAG